VSDKWLIYEQVAERLQVTLRAARARAFRGRWSKIQGNDGRARVRLPDEPLAPAREPARGVSVCPTDAALVDALESHVASVKTENERLASALDTLKAELGTRSSELAAECERAGKAINGFEALLRTESERADRSIAAFEQLAHRLEAMAAEHAHKPW
jgi:hypothetical protein